jgi:hypothetical protein
MSQIHLRRHYGIRMTRKEESGQFCFDPRQARLMETPRGRPTRAPDRPIALPTVPAYRAPGAMKQIHLIHTEPP